MTEGAGLLGVAGEGSVHRSGDGGRTWPETGPVGGGPEALTVVARGDEVAVYAAVAQKGIGASEDGGRTISMRYAGDAP